MKRPNPISLPSIPMALPFFLLFLLLLSTLPLIPSQYTLPNHHFINCGSISTTTFTGHTFTPDLNPTSFSVSGGRAAAENTNPSSNTPTLYQTARVLEKKSWYEFPADQHTTFLMVRFHFYPFLSDFNLPTSKFDVSISGFLLLSGFQVQNLTVREFIVPFQSGKSFKIEFDPSPDSFAFINAIEAFKAPPELLRSGVDSPPYISPAGTIEVFDENLTSSYALTPVHRVNVGGPSTKSETDTLGRTWVADDPFILNRATARNSTPHEGPILYQNGGATKFDAPDNVYGTSKQLNISSTRTGNLFNITWSFGVDKRSLYLVRAHFCDIVSTGLKDEGDAFNLFVCSHHKEHISPRQLATPFYVDFVVKSVDSKFVNISIGAIRNNNQAPFLNGLEIMELVKDSSRGNPKGEGEGKGKKRTLIAVGIGGGGVVVLLIGFLIGLKCKKPKRVTKTETKTESNVTPSYGIDSYTTVNHPSPNPNLNLGLRVPFIDLMRATNGFHPSLMIGQGGFGRVYKGILPNGMKVAVKRGESGQVQGRPEFVTEITVLSRIRHRHLVSLIGYCDERSEMILVYEFMEKGTLQEHLYNSTGPVPKLSWKRRVEICISAAQGLNYLHTGTHGGVIHRDVKSTNILLDGHYIAKVADFGISWLDNVDQDDIHASSGIKGTFGYLDPEYIRCLKLTQKSDVYSFGVVLLEVLCARPALNNKLPHTEVNLADWATARIKNGEVEKIVDPFLAGKINENSLRKFVETVEKCLKETGDERPTMIDVLWDLEFAAQLQETGVAVGGAHDDSTVSTLLQLPPQESVADESEVDVEANGESSSSYLSESRVFSLLKMDDAR